MKKHKKEADRDLKKTPAAHSEKSGGFSKDLGPILGSIWEPKSMKNHIEI